MTVERKREKRVGAYNLFADQSARLEHIAKRAGVNASVLLRGLLEEALTQLDQQPDKAQWWVGLAKQGEVTFTTFVMKRSQELRTYHVAMKRRRLSRFKAHV